MGPWKTIAALWTLARPRGVALIALLPMIGFTFTYWDHGCVMAPSKAAAHLALLAALWAVPHAGTLWLNAALDRDQGPVLFGQSAPVPPGIQWPAYATLALTPAVAFAVDVELGICVLGCAVLAVLYSHPKTAWKGRALLGPLSNALGYGVLSPLGGMLYSPLPFTFRGALVLVVSVAFILAAYLAAQAFQEEEDRARGYHTLVALRGPRVTLAVTRLFLGLAVLMTLGLAVAGYFPRAVLISLPAFVAADRWLVHWRNQPGGGGPVFAAAFFRRLTVAGLLCLAAVSIDYLKNEYDGAPRGGLGTSLGRPLTQVCFK